LPDVGCKIAGSIPKKGTVAEPGLVSIAPGKGVTTIDPVSVCLSKAISYVLKGMCDDLPEGIDNRTLLLPGIFVVPVPRLGVDGLTNTTQDAQAAKVIAINVVRSKAAKESNSSGCGVELGKFVLLDSLPIARGSGVYRSGFENGSGDSVSQRAVNNVARKSETKC